MKQYDTLIDTVIDNVIKLKNLHNARNVVWKAFLSLGLKCSHTCGRGLRILILNTPCWGFGDIVFGMKLATYLRKWYGVKVTIATTHVDGFLKLGESKDNLIRLSGLSSFVECRKFAKLKMEKQIPTQDLIFVAPLQASLDYDLADVKKLVKYADKFNTFYFSEYNDSSWKELDFPMGVGDDNLGIFISTPPPTPGPRLVKNPYAVAYIADWESIDNADRCFLGFIEMVAAKYSKQHDKFDIVVAPWIARNIAEFESRIRRKVLKYFPTVVSVYPDRSPTIISSENTKSSKVLTIRGDVLPLPNIKMIKLMRDSVRDILLTGDQSISDVLSCCPSKNIFYQIAEWKETFAKALAKELPNKYMLKKRTSCGTLKALSYKSSYGDFIRKWNFKNRGKPKLDAVILAAKAKKGDQNIRIIEETIENSRKLSTLKNKLRDF